MKKLHDTLVLNKAWIPAHIVSWRKGMSLIYQDSGHALDRDYVAYDFKNWLDFSAKNAHDYAKVHTVSLTIAVPEIVVLTKYDKLPSRDVKYSRENVFHRDHNKCQYCGVVFDIKELTIDHIIPRALGGKTLWNNVVAACKTCNAKKADKTLIQADMKLLKPPTKPRWLNPLSNVGGKAHICTTWQKFMDRVDITSE